MLIRLLAVGNKMPAWVKSAFDDYAKRFPRTIRLNLIEIPPEKRTKQTVLQTAIDREGEKIIAILDPQHLIIALDQRGTLWSTETLAKELKQWLQTARGIDLIIGGADGLSSAVLDKSRLQWSLSPLTLPHPLVRVLVTEQLYRAASILNHHPYHRG